MIERFESYRRERTASHERGDPTPLPPEIEEGGLVEPFIHKIALQEEQTEAHKSDARIAGDIYPQILQERQHRLETGNLYPHEKYTHVQRRRMNPMLPEQSSLRKRLMRRISKNGKR